MTAIRHLILVVAIAVWIFLPIHSHAAEPLRKIDYARDVRPILSRHCFPCHGPDESARQSELRLDERLSATRELPTGKRAIVPGRPDQHRPDLGIQGSRHCFGHGGNALLA